MNKSDLKIVLLVLSIILVIICFVSSIEVVSNHLHASEDTLLCTFTSPSGEKYHIYHEQSHSTDCYSIEIRRSFSLEVIKSDFYCKHDPNIVQKTKEKFLEQEFFAQSLKCQ